MAKILKFDSEAREKLLKGINTLTEAVATTLGPKGRNVALDKKWGAPNVVHDGVTVAKEIDLEDPFENMGAQLLKEAASKTDDLVGDGTTTATIIAHSIVKEGLKLVSIGYNPMQLREELEEGANRIIDLLSGLSKKLTTNDEITQIATISAQNEEIGKKISEAINKVGKDGVVTVEEGKTMEMSVDYKEGMEFDKGFASPYFITDSDRLEATIEDAYILIADKKLSDAQDFVKFLEKFISISKNIVIISDDIDNDLMTMLVLNKLKGIFNFLAVGAPGFGDRRKEILEDIAILTGGIVFSEELGRKWESIEIGELGRASRVTSNKDNTLIVDGKGAKNKIEARIAHIRRELAASDSEFDKEKLQERLAKLTGGVAVVNVGAATEVEMKEKKERVVDAVAATKAAIEEGIVIGGEMALYQAREAICVGGKITQSSTGKMESVRNFEKNGYKVLYEALQEPLRRLLENAYGNDISQISGILASLYIDIERAIFAGKKEGIVDMKTVKFPKIGHDVIRKDNVDMFDVGIIDPVKVTRTALQNAVSIASMILTTQVLITDAPEKEKAPQMPPGGMPEY